MKATIERIEYDPNRSCHIMLVKFEDNQMFYYLAPQNIKIGDQIQNGSALAAILFARTKKVTLSVVEMRY